MNAPAKNDVPHGHEPVLLAEVFDLLAPKPGELAVDCTLGRGGHAERLMSAVSPGGRLIALDRDPRNLEYAMERLDDPAADLRHENFAHLGDTLGADVGKVDVLLADLGVSTNQITTGDYGLSFSEGDAPLDMRLDPNLRDTAADLLSRWPEKLIADTIYELSGERFSRRIARKIVEKRKAGEGLRTTGELALLVRKCVPRGKGKAGGIDPATRTFQALRMAVNGEVDALVKLLDAIPKVLAPGGRAGVISFHSGEDRLVKNAFRDLAHAGGYALVTKKPVTPGEAEVEANPRSRSSKLRVLRKD